MKEKIEDNPVPSLDNLLEKYKNFRDSDICEGVDSTEILAFLYFIKVGNLEGKSFNPKYYKNTESDVIKERLKDLELLYNNKLQNGVETDKEQPEFKWCHNYKNITKYSRPCENGEQCKCN